MWLNISTLEKECINWDEIKNLPKSDLDIWPVYKDHKVKAIKLGDKYRLIDLEISGLIKDLNKAGHKTDFCCAGHKVGNFRNCCGYISFTNTEENRKFIARVALAWIEDISQDRQHSMFYIDPPCVIRFKYSAEVRLEILEKLRNLFYDKTGNIISI